MGVQDLVWILPVGLVVAIVIYIMVIRSNRPPSVVSKPNPRPGGGGTPPDDGDDDDLPTPRPEA
jgi:hypothetical protein